MNKTYQHRYWWIRMGRTLSSFLMWAIPLIWIATAARYLIVGTPLNETPSQIFQFYGLSITGMIHSLQHLLGLSDLEIKGDKFRFKTKMLQEHWHKFDEVVSVKRFSKYEDRLAVEMKQLPFIFHLIRIIPKHKHPRFLIYKQIEGYEELVAIFKEQASVNQSASR